MSGQLPTPPLLVGVTYVTALPSLLLFQGTPAFPRPPELLVESECRATLALLDLAPHLGPPPAGASR